MNRSPGPSCPPVSEPAASRRAPAGRREGHPLVAALRGARLPAAWAHDACQQLTEAADHHGIVIALYGAYLRAEDAPAAVPELAARARGRCAEAMQITSASLDVSHWLQLAAVPHAVVKGPALAVAYSDASRQFVDLDVLVMPEHVPRAVAVLQDRGARLLEQVAWPRPDGIGELALGLPGGVTVDLHADLLVHPHERRAFHLPTEALLARATTVPVLGQPLPVLCLEDALIHVALHAMVSGGDRLVWLADLDALSRLEQISWPTVVSRARDARAGLVVGVMLDRSVQVLRSPVPAPTLRALRQGGTGWAMLLRLFERWRPTETNFGRGLHGQVLIRATRDSTTTSMVTLAGLVWTDVIRSVVHNPNHPWRARRRQWWQSH